MTSLALLAINTANANYLEITDSGVVEFQNTDYDTDYGIDPTQPNSPRPITGSFSKYGLVHFDANDPNIQAIHNTGSTYSSFDETSSQPIYQTNINSTGARFDDHTGQGKIGILTATGSDFFALSGADEATAHSQATTADEMTLVSRPTNITDTGPVFESGIGSRWKSNELVFGEVDKDGKIINDKISTRVSNEGIYINNDATDKNHAVRKSQLDAQVSMLQQRINQMGNFVGGYGADTSKVNANARNITALQNTNTENTANISSNKTAIASNTAGIKNLNTRVNALEKANNNIAALNKNLKQGMAKQAALNGLFQPYGVGKLSTSAAIGGSGKETAVAIGAGYRFNENLATKGGIAFSSDSFSSDNQDYNYNIGVNYEW